MSKQNITGTIAMLIILAAIASLFFQVNEVGEEIIRAASLVVIGFYFGGTQLAGVLTGRKG